MIGCTELSDLRQHLSAFSALSIAPNLARLQRVGRSNVGNPGSFGDRAIIGFRGALKTELTERAFARRGAEYLRDVLGANPHEGLVRKLTAARDGASGATRTQLNAVLEAVLNNTKLAEAMGVRPARVFAEIAALKKLQTAEKTLVDLAARYPQAELLGRLVADGKLRLPGGESVKDFGVSRTVEFGPLRAEELRVKTSRGVEGLKLLNNYYGDAMASLVRALVDSGHTRLAYFGTAGGVGDGVRVGDVHVPRRIYDWSGELASNGVRNSFLDYFRGRATPLGERLTLNVELGNVFSPAEETMAWLEDVRARGLSSIEVENSYITRETPITRLYESVGGLLAFLSVKLTLKPKTGQVSPKA